MIIRISANNKDTFRRCSHFGSATLLAVATLACSGTQTHVAAPPAAPAPQPESAPAPAPPAVAEAATTPVEPLPPPVVVQEVGLKVPESVLYDAEQDVYFVSNIKGKPADADRNGFISKVSPDGKVLNLKFIDGAKGSWLNAPKGMALHGDTLYVTDITFVRMFDRKTGAYTGKIGVPSATFVNDISIAPDGTVYVTDTGWKGGKDALENTGTDAVYVLDTNQRSAKPLVRGKELGNPNGIYADDDGVWVVTAHGDLYRVGKDGKVSQKNTLPGKSLDGIMRLADGSFLVSSWATKTVYRGTPGAAFTPLVTGVESPADIGFDTKRSQLLIPVFKQDQLQFHAVRNTGAPAQPAVAAQPPEAAQAAAVAAQSAKAVQPAAKAKPAAKPAAPAVAAKADPAKPAAPAAHAAPVAAAAPAAAAKPAASPDQKVQPASYKKTQTTPAAPAAPKTEPAPKK